MINKFKKRIIAFIMALIILATILYVFYGKNWLVEQQYIQKHKNIEYVKNELMQKMLDIEKQSQDVLNEMLNLSYDIDLFQKQTIIMEKTIEKTLDIEITHKPFFDYKNIYLISSHKLIVLKKNLSKIRWNKQFKEKVIWLELIDANRIIVLTDQNKMICLNRDTGKEIWQKKLKTVQTAKESSTYQISLNNFKRLDSSIILVHSENEIELIENITGSTLSVYHADKRIDHISDFDILEKCIYYIEENKISKLVLMVKS